MRILTIHNKYQIRGGEDECREAEAGLLAAHGHQVRAIEFDNDGINPFNAAAIGIQTAWSWPSYQRTLKEIRSWKPDLVSVHNFFPVASPSVYYAARKCNVRVIQTLHNYRLLCPNGTFFRDQRVCEDCCGKLVPWPGVLHSCYRHSRAATIAVASMLAFHNLLKTWRTRIDMFIALTDFARKKFIEGGLPAERLAVKPNFVWPDPGPGEGKGDYLLFVGRLTEEKGTKVMIDAWKTAACPGRLIVAGEGPLAALVAREASQTPSIVHLGRRPLEEIYRLLGDARALVFPSTWYEGMPRIIVEALSRGTPVIASDLGSMTEMITEGRNGRHVEPGDAGSLARAMRSAFDRTEEMYSMRASARNEFELKYTAERNYDLLMGIYSRVLGYEAAAEPGL